MTSLSAPALPRLPGRVGFRDLAIDIVKERGAIALTYSVLGKLWALVILWMALRMVGIEPDVLSGLSIFVVWVLLITAIPITPGGIGIAEMAYIGLFTAVAGDKFSDVIAAGVILLRLMQWALPIPVGWLVVLFWRRQGQRGQLPDPFALPDRGADPVMGS